MKGMTVTDAHGQAVTTDDETARRYDLAAAAIMRLQSGSAALLDEALLVDEGFALAHATKAAVGYELDEPVDLAAHLRAAELNVAQRGNARERAFVGAVGDRLRGDVAAYRTYAEQFPQDPVGLMLAMPTVAFSGAYSEPGEAWAWLDTIADEHDDAWWFTGLQAFGMVERGRLDEAAAYADASLVGEPRGGTAAHARAHVNYETNSHAQGAEWLDEWIGQCGDDAIHQAHFTWHVALHELALGDIDAVLARYDRDLAPTVLTGMRALVDSGSLLWRLHLDGIDDRSDDIEAVRAAAGDEITRPSNAFSAMHAAIAHAAAGDADALDSVARCCQASSERAMPDVAAPLAEALGDYVRADFSRAADELLAVAARSAPIGASKVQRAIIEDTAIAALIQAERTDEAAALIDARMDRSPESGATARPAPPAA